MEGGRPFGRAFIALSSFCPKLCAVRAHAKGFSALILGAIVALYGLLRGLRGPLAAFERIEDKMAKKSEEPSVAARRRGRKRAALRKVSRPLAKDAAMRAKKSKPVRGSALDKALAAAAAAERRA